MHCQALNQYDGNDGMMIRTSMMAMMLGMIMIEMITYEVNYNCKVNFYDKDDKNS